MFNEIVDLSIMKKDPQQYAIAQRKRSMNKNDPTDMILEESYTLSSGIDIPKLGLGTWLIPNDEVAQAVKDAVKIGYRHIDTAQAYKNEDGVGKGIRNC